MQTENQVQIHYLVDGPPLGYGQGLALQESLHRDRRAGLVGGTILFLEHKPVVSVGRRGESQDILVGDDVLAGRGIEVYRSDRGGQVTFHGPGQLVVYFIVDLGTKVRQVRRFIEGIEQGFITYLRDQYNLNAHLEPELPGIWLPEGKVAAVGVSLKDRVSMHGVALNLVNNLEDFTYIVPCGIKTRPVVSLASVGAPAQSPQEAARSLTPYLVGALGYESWFS